jgi:UDP-N-acetylmuramoyl-tripeptide--D-alanyl-D-alanine ligase
VAVTGSNGKTTVKEMLGSIFGQLASTLTTRGNLNNDIGLPLTLLRLEAAHRYAVVEMGANHPGEIAHLSSLARPTVALITNAGPAHLEGFGSVEGVAHAKGEIFSGLVPEGVAVINADDGYAPLWRRLAGDRQILDFGIEQPAEIRARMGAPTPGLENRFELVTPVGRCDVTMPFPGRHNVMNALAASAAALAAGADLAAIDSGLRNAAGIAGRLQSRPARHGARLLDDTYNANPASVDAALAVLAASPGTRALVLGDMAEMGPEAARFHAEVGATASRLGIDALWATGELSRAAAEAFGTGARHFPDIKALVDALCGELRPDLTLLIKGSRRAGMERVVQALAAEEGGTGTDSRGAGRCAGEDTRPEAEA